MGYKSLRTSSLIKVLRREFEAVEDRRNGPNKRYEMADVALSAFAVFFTQSPSFLAYQRNLQVRQGRCNLESIFGVRKVPSDNQIRNVLDSVPLEMEFIHDSTAKRLSYRQVRRVRRELKMKNSVLSVPALSLSKGYLW